MKKNIFSIIFTVALVIFLLASFFMNLYLLDNKDTLNYELRKRDNLIENLNRKDSVTQNILDNRYSIDSLTKSRNEVTVGELIRYSNDLNKEIDKLLDEHADLYKRINRINDSLWYYKIYYDYSQSQFDHKFITTPNASGGTNYRFIPNAVKLQEYKKCEEKNNKLQSDNSLMNIYKIALEEYNIEIKEESYRSNGVTSTSRYIHAPRLDSALMFYRIFKNELKYNKSKNEWYIDSKITITSSKNKTISDTVK